MSADHTSQLADIARTNRDVFVQLTRLYDRFPMEVRFEYGINWFAQHLNNLLKLEKEEPGTQEKYGDMMYGEVMSLLQGMQPNADLLKMASVQRCLQQLTTNFSEDKKGFAQYLSACANAELKIVEAYQARRRGTTSAEASAMRGGGEEVQFLTHLHETEQTCHDVDRKTQNFAQRQGEFLMEYQQLTDQIQHYQQASRNPPNASINMTEIQTTLQRLEQQKDLKVSQNYQLRQELFKDYKSLVEKVEQNVQQLWRAIYQWHQNSKLDITGLKDPSAPNIDVLEKWCLLLNKSLITVISQSQKLLLIFGQLRYAQNETDHELDDMESQKKRLEQLLQQHLDHIFVVDKGPPQILKVITGKSLGFAMSVRILGGHGLGLDTSCISVTAELYKEENLPAAMKERHPHKKGICEIQNGKDKPMDFCRDTGTLRSHFNSVQLQKVKSLEKGPEKLVTENMHAMVYYTFVKVNGHTYYLATMSLPMTLISHVLQDCQAKAFLIWDAAFSKPDHERRPFEHKSDAEWGDVARILDSLFKMNTGTGLNEDHLLYLARIAFKDKTTSDFSRRKITRNQLLRDKLHKDFSFWKWFYANMNLIKERLKQEWEDEIIYGFIGKDDIQQKLQGREPGTFLLRFSERDIENTSRADICGCLTLAVVEHDPSDGKNKVFHVKEHLTPKDIAERGLATILEAFEVKDSFSKENRPLLKFLYPNKPFDDTFKKYIVEKRRNESSAGYRQGKLRIQICLFDDPDMLPKNRNPVSLPMSPSTVATNSPYNLGDMNPDSPIAGGSNPQGVAIVSPLNQGEGFNVNNQGMDNNGMDNEEMLQITDEVFDQLMLISEQDGIWNINSGNSAADSGQIDSGQSVEHPLTSGGQSSRSH